MPLAASAERGSASRARRYASSACVGSPASRRALPRLVQNVALAGSSCDGALERLHRLRRAALLDQHQPEAVRRGRVGRLQRERRLLGARGFAGHPGGRRRHRQIVIHRRVARPARDEAAVDLHRLRRAARVLQRARVGRLEDRRVRIGARQLRQPGQRAARIPVRQPRQLALEGVPRGDVFRGIRRRIVHGRGGARRRTPARAAVRRHPAAPRPAAGAFAAGRSAAACAPRRRARASADARLRVSPGSAVTSYSSASDESTSFH